MAVGGGIAAPGVEGVVVVVGGTPPGGAPASGYEARKRISRSPPAPVKLPPAYSRPPVVARALTVPLNGPLPAPFEPTGFQLRPSNSAIPSASGSPFASVNWPPAKTREPVTVKA